MNSIVFSTIIIIDIILVVVVLLVVGGLSRFCQYTASGPHKGQEQG